MVWWTISSSIKIMDENLIIDVYSVEMINLNKSVTQFFVDAVNQKYKNIWKGDSIVNGSVFYQCSAQ